MELNLENVLKRYSIFEERDYQVTSITEIISALNTGNDSIIHLPTGTGKTIVYSPIAVEAAYNGYRTCISCYTKYMQGKIMDDISGIPDGDNAVVIMGDSNYKCPKTGDYVDNWFCETEVINCVESNINCDKLQKKNSFIHDNLIITNHAKFLKSRSADWDLIIVDDSHSFENVLEQVYQTSLYYHTLESVYQKYEKDDVLSDFIGGFLDYFDTIYESDIHRNAKQGTISTDNVSNIATDIITEENEDEIKSKIMTLPGKDKIKIKEIFGFIQACIRSSFFRFYLRKDWYDLDNFRLSELITTEVPENQRRKVRRRFGDAQVIFATATPGNPDRHAEVCTKRVYSPGMLKIVPSIVGDVVDNWFNELDIYCINDIGDTRTRPSMNEALKLTLNIFESYHFKSILLFKNYNDQKLAYKRLSPYINDLYFIESDSDQDEIQELANKNQVILASASTRLWEGIDIQDLYLGIIYTPPFIRVPVHIPKKISFLYNKRIMFRRLQQGIGRMIRNINDKGLCLLMDDNFKKYVNESAFSDQLRERIKYVNKNQVMSVIKLFEEGL